MDVAAGLAGVVAMHFAANAWNVTICLLLYAIWRELRMISRAR
jgi:hypothetical protein